MEVNVRRKFRFEQQNNNINNNIENNGQTEQPKQTNTSLVKSVNDRIYFYKDVDQSSMLELKQQIETQNKLFDNISIQLEQLQMPISPVIHLHISSWGGDAFCGLHLYDFLKNNKYPIYTYIDGFVASAASLIYLAGTKRQMSNNSFILVHQLQNWFVGNFSQLQDHYNTCQKIMNKLRCVYLHQLDIQQAQLNELLKHDLWLNREQAMKYGFIK